MFMKIKGRNLKQYMILGFIVVIIFLIFILVPKNYFGITPKTNDFELKAEISAPKYNSNQEIQVFFTLKNLSFNSYKLTHGSNLITVSYVKSGEDRKSSIVPAIGKYSYIGPKRVISSNKTFSIHETGQYTVFVEAFFKINNSQYEYTQSFDILVE